MITEMADHTTGLTAAASQLLQITNDLEGCRILLDAGDHYRRNGASEQAIHCYNKAIEDLTDKQGTDAHRLFIQTVIRYSKDRQSMGKPEITASLLKQALDRCKALNDDALHAILLLRMASVAYVQMAHQAAQHYFLKGRAMAEKSTDPLVMKTLDACTVVHYCYSGRFKDAIKQYESIESGFSKKTPAYTPSFRVGVILGLSYAGIGEISQGLGMVNQLRDDALAFNDEDAAARGTIFIAWILIIKNDIKNAAKQISDTLKSSKKLRS